MKKVITLLAVLITVLALTGCKKDSPFDPPRSGFELIDMDSISLKYNNGLETVTIYEYTFSNTYKVFKETNPLTNSIHYDFTNINNYKEISDDFEVFLNSFDIYSDETNVTNYGQKVDLSLGATIDDYNYETIELSENTVDVYRYITTDDGVQLRLTYTIFTTINEVYYIPSYIVIETVDIHEATLFSYLQPNNEYYNSSSVIIDYRTRIVPIPPRAAFTTDYETYLQTDKYDLGHFKRVQTTTEHSMGEFEICETEDQLECKQPLSTTVEVQVFEYSKEEVLNFYIENYGGSYYYEDFIFVNDGTTFKLSNIEYKRHELEDGSIIDVVAMIIELY